MKHIFRVLFRSKNFFIKDNVYTKFACNAIAGVSTNLLFVSQFWEQFKKTFLTKR